MTGKTALNLKIDGAVNPNAQLPVTGGIRYGKFLQGSGFIDGIFLSNNEQYGLSNTSPGLKTGIAFPGQLNGIIET